MSRVQSHIILPHLADQSITNLHDAMATAAPAFISRAFRVKVPRKCTLQCLGIEQVNPQRSLSTSRNSFYCNNVAEIQYMAGGCRRYINVPAWADILSGGC